MIESLARLRRDHGKIITVFLLLLMIAPIPATLMMFIYMDVFFDSPFSEYFEAGKRGYNMFGIRPLVLYDILSRDESILQEMMRLIHNNEGFPKMLTSHEVALTLGNGDIFMRVKLLSVIMPWCLSMVLAVIIPQFISIISNRRRQFNSSRRKERRKIRQAHLSSAFSCFKKVLQKQDYLNITDECCIPEGENTERNMIPILLIPSSGTSVERIKSDTKREVPGMCVICLMTYNPGDTLVWSSNVQCRHTYHESCILRWLVRQKNSSCPSCRQDFIDKEHLALVKSASHPPERYM